MLNPELLHKFQTGQCSPAERQQVQQWLENDDLEVDNTFEIPSNLSETKQSMWADMEAHLEVSTKKARWRNYKSWFAVAALLLATISISAYFLQNNTPFIAVENNLGGGLKALHEKNYDLILARNSSAEMDAETGILAIQGEVMIKPKKNMVIALTSTENKLLKQGVTYYLVKSKMDHAAVVFAGHELIFLSPVLQKHLKFQFRIS